MPPRQAATRARRPAGPAEEPARVVRDAPVPEAAEPKPRSRSRRAAPPAAPAVEPVQAAVEAPPPAPAPEERPLGELLADATTELTALFRKELELAKLETKEQITQASRAGALFGATALVTFLAVLLLSFAAAWGLAEIVPEGVAFLIVGVIYGVLAALFFAEGRRRMAGVRPVPEKTIETLKEDVEWARTVKQSV